MSYIALHPAYPTRAELRREDAIEAVVARDMLKVAALRAAIKAAKSAVLDCIDFETVMPVEGMDAGSVIDALNDCLPLDDERAARLIRRHAEEMVP